MRILRPTLFALALTTACAPEASDVDRPAEDEAPLASYDELFAGAPANSTLPDDNKADAVYPKQFDLVAEQSPVKSQGSRGVCSIFSTVALMENLYIKAGVAAPDFSEQYLQWSTKFELGVFPSSSGSNGRYNLQAINKFGIVTESLWPYESFPWNESHDPRCTGEESTRPTICFTNGEPPATAKAGEKFKLPRNKAVNTNSIKAHLTSKKTAVIVDVDFFYQAWNHRASTLPINNQYWREGIITYPNAKDREESAKHRAGHSILIVGWDDDMEVQSRDGDGNLMVDAAGNPVMEKGFYIIKNSWGTGSFGVDNPYGKGYGYLSMRYVLEEGSAQVSDVPTVSTPTVPGELFPATPNAAIPDNSTAGVSSSIEIPAGKTLASLTVKVDIAHTYIGDLKVTLSKGGKTVTLHGNAGGGTDNLVASFSPTDWNGADRGGTWTLSVVDNAASDVGTLKAWSIETK